MSFNLEEFELGHGEHVGLGDGACVMEMVSYLADEPWSDQPKCACPLLTHWAIFVNDNVSQKNRQRLKKLIPKLINSKVSTAMLLKRAEFFATQAKEVYKPLANHSDISKNVAANYLKESFQHIKCANEYFEERGNSLHNIDDPIGVDTYYATESAASVAHAAKLYFKVSDNTEWEDLIIKTLEGACNITDPVKEEVADAKS